MMRILSRFLIFLSGQIPHLPLVPSGALPGTAQPPPTSPAITAATAAAFQTRPPAVPTSGTANTPGQPQQMITAGTKKDCIRLRGLPYEAQVEHILEFLGKDLSNNIVTQGVHMVINSQVIPKVFFPSPSFSIILYTLTDDALKSHPVNLGECLHAPFYKFFLPSKGSTLWRSVHPDVLGACCRPGQSEPSQPVHGVREEAAIHRGVPVLRRRHEPRPHRQHRRITGRIRYR